MMKKIAEGYNTHIVNMVGCVTLQEPLCLITEFIPYGDLISYLKHQRKKVKLDVYTVCIKRTLTPLLYPIIFDV